MAKNRTTKKCGPSRRLSKKSKAQNVVNVVNQKKLQKAFVEIGDQKGYSSQDRFERIFTGDFYRPYWFLGIRRATKHEDFSEGTDFFVITRDRGEIRFDVKSSFHHFDKQKEAQETLPIFVWGIVIKPHISDHDIRRLVFEKCEKHISRLKNNDRNHIYST